MIAYVFNELFREKTRIILTILAIAWGTFSVALMLAVGEGLRINFGTSVAKSGHNLLEVTPGATSNNYQGLRSGSAISLYPKFYDNLKKSVSNIAAISQQYIVHYQLQHGSNKFLANIAAVSPDFAMIHNIAIIPDGRFINALDIKQRAKVIVLGTQAWQQLFPSGHNPVGQHIKFNNNISMLVIGVMKNKPQMIGQQIPDAYYSWIPQSTYRLLALSHTIDSLAISYRKAIDLPIMKRQIQTLVALANNADPNDSHVVVFKDVSAKQRQSNHFLLGLEIFLGIIGGLTLVVAGSGVANVMLASVKQNTAEIGLRMAIGAKPYQILIHYIVESLIATIIGGVIGIIFTIMIVDATHFIPLHGKVFEIFGKPRPQLSWIVIMIVIMVLGAMGLAAGFFPAKIAASIAPARALRHE